MNPSKSLKKILELVSRLFRPQYNIFQLILLIIIAFYPFGIAAIRTPCQCWWTLLTLPFDFNRILQKIFTISIVLLLWLSLSYISGWKSVEESDFQCHRSRKKGRKVFGFVLCFSMSHVFYFISIDDDVDEDVRLSRVKRQEKELAKFVLCFLRYII